MRITPLDIRKQPFRKKLMGFDPDEVNSFLEMVAAEFETLMRAHDELGTNVKTLTTRLEEYQHIEKTLNQTLLTAQKATDEARLNAQKEAELIIRDAEARAHKYEDESRRRVHDLQSDLVRLRNQRDSFLARFKAMLATQLQLLSTLRGDLTDSEETDFNDRHLDPDETLAEVPPEETPSSGPDIVV